MLFLDGYSYICIYVNIRRSAFKHGVERDDIEHALRHPTTIVEIDLEHDPRRLLTIGPSQAGQLLEIVSLSLNEGDVVIHAMKLRPTYFSHLPRRHPPI